MACDDAEILILFAEEISDPVAYITVGSTVEAVTADVVLLGDLIRKSICVSLRRHCLMESCVEDCNLGCACRKNVLACLDTDEVCRIVERT